MEASWQALLVGCVDAVEKQGVQMNIQIQGGLYRRYTAQTLTADTLPRAALASPYVLFGATLDASGSFHARVDIPATLVGLRFATQAVLFDPIFGPLTGSNAVAVRLVP